MSPRSPSSLPLRILLLAAAAVRASLPYNPTTIFAPSTSDGSFIYVLEPQSSAYPKGRLLAVSSSADLSSTGLPTSTISSSLPFIGTGSGIPYVPALDSDGSIVVYTGNCTKGASQSLLWRFLPDSNSITGSGTWTKQTISNSDSYGAGTMTGANYLAGAITFKSNMTIPEPTVYVFGGMCPQSNSSTSKWTSAAQYSNQMLSFATLSNTKFSISTNVGQPIPEAGFSVTPLPSTFSNTSAGPQSQQNFLLVGGHTETAFINPNQVAIYSLPQASWTFQNTELPNGKHDPLSMLTRSTAISTFEPRSGHTATLTSDGSELVVIGGWVGDVMTPAQPQVAVLDLGIGYGGSGSWQWSLPTMSDSPFNQKHGIYGHGAAMLPGDVIMVTGGYSIDGSTSSRAKRDSQAQSPRTYFYNTTSKEWITSYSASSIPGTSSPTVHSSTTTTSSSSSTTTTKAGLGAGIGLGLLALIVAAVYGFLYSRRLKRERDEKEHEIRDKEINDFSEGVLQASRPISSITGNYSSQQGQPSAAYPWPCNLSGNNSWNNWNGISIREAERSGLDVNAPSPHRGLRRSMHSRGYLAAESGRFSHASPGMHAIEERDEENSSANSSRQVSGKANPAPTPSEDLFQDPVSIGSTSRTVKPIRRVPVGRGSSQSSPDSPAEERQHQMTQWIQDWQVADSLMSGRKGRESQDKTGRSSPDKSDRTTSDLSDRSLRSNLSSKSGGNARNPALQTGKLFIPKNLNPFATPLASPTKENTSSGSSRPSTSEKVEGETESQNCSTSKGIVRPDNEPIFARATTVNSQHARSKNRGYVGGWVGSVRRAITPRVLSNAGRSASLTNDIVRPRSGIVIGGDGYYEYGASPLTTRRALSRSNSIKQGQPNSKDAAAAAFSSTVRRSVSDGGAFWRFKRGAKDWDFDPDSQPLLDPPNELSRSEPRPSSPIDIEPSLPDTDDWDVETAIQQRVVQVMFTVPREQLRVVNADPDAISEVSVAMANETQRTGNMEEGKLIEFSLNDVDDFVKRGGEN